jgi:hypothetical protein
MNLFEIINVNNSNLTWVNNNTKGVAAKWNCENTKRRAYLQNKTLEKSLLKLVLV